MQLGWFKSRQPSAARCGPPSRRSRAGSGPVGDPRGGQDHGRYPAGNRGRAKAAHRMRARSRYVNARTAFGGTKQRQSMMPPRIVALENPVSPEAAPVRRLPVGAEPQPDGGVHFRVWAPRCRRDRGRDRRSRTGSTGARGRRVLLLWSPTARAGMRYRFRLDRGETALPDPASRFQPEGPHGPSEIVDPATFAWTDGAWRGIAREQLVIYEMHVGTFTQEGSWQAAARELPALAELGITCIEMMPVAEFSGRFGWGYDGVNLFAPTRLYGQPDDFRRFVDRAHALGIAVILDVVYNHLGPDGNYLKSFSAAYFTDRYDNEWGEAINFDGPDAGPVREFFLANAGYWIDEYHLDGLRLDATQQIFDRSEDHILAAIVRQVRSGGARAAHLCRRRERAAAGAAAAPARARRLRARRAVERRFPSQRHGRADRPSRGLLHRLPRPPGRVRRRRQARLPLSGAALPVAEESARHARASTCRRNASSSFCRTTIRSPIPARRRARVTRWRAPAGLRAMTAYFLLMPGIPMLFQGQEFGASSPFFYFADHEVDLSRAVREGRGAFLAQFPSLASERDAGAARRSRRHRHLPSIGARSWRTATTCLDLCPASRSSGAAARGPGARTAALPGRRRGARGRSLAAALFRPRRRRPAC